jgi:hypothetical protein
VTGNSRLTPHGCSSALFSPYLHPDKTRVAAGCKLNLPSAVQEEETVKGETGERWRKLCEQAAIEQDSDRLIELIKEINRLLEEKKERLKSARKPHDQIQ